MEFLGVLPITRKGHGYLFIVVDRFSNMCILMPYKNTISRKEAINLSFGQAWVHFGIPRRIVLDRT